jgi:hypothetical protein
MPIKKTKKEEATPKTEENISKDLSTDSTPKKEEATFTLSSVEKMMSDLESKMMNKFQNQISRLKTKSAQSELDEDLAYVADLEEDYLEKPVVFFAFSFNFAIHGDKKRGVLSEPPHGPVNFKPIIRTKRKRGKETQIISVSSVKVHSKKEAEYLRGHSQFGIAFYENMESAMNVDAVWANKMVEAQQSITRLSDVQVIARSKQEGISVSQSPEDMRRQLVEKIARRSVEQHEKKLYGGIRNSIVDNKSGRAIVERKI